MEVNAESIPSHLTSAQICDSSVQGRRLCCMDVDVVKDIRFKKVVSKPQAQKRVAVVIISQYIARKGPSSLWLRYRSNLEVIG